MHFDYVQLSWYSLARKKIGKKTQVTQNRCICFCIKLNSRHYTEVKKLKEINWTPTKERVEQHIATNIFKHWKRASSVSEICKLGNVAYLANSPNLARKST